MISPGVRSIVTNAIYLISSRGLTILARAIYVVVLAKFLGPEMYGLFAYGTSWYLAFLPLTYLGLDVIASYEVGCGSADAAKIVSHTLTLRITAALVVAILCAVAGVYVEQEPLARTLLLIFSTGLVGRSLALWSDGVFTAFEAAKESFRVHMLFRPAEVVIGLTVLYAGGDVIDLTIAHALTWWGHALVSLLMARRLLGGRRFDFQPGLHILPLLATGVPLGLIAVLEAWLLNGPVVTFRINGGSETELGQFSLALQALLIATGMGTVVSKAALPIVVRSVGRGDDKDRVFAEEMLRLSAWLGLCGWLIGTAWGEALVATVFGDRYAATGEYLGLVLVLFYPFVGGISLVHVLMARQEAWRLVWISLVSAALMTGLQPWAQQAFGLGGVILAMSVGFGTWLLGLAWRLHQLGSLGLGRSLFMPWGMIAVVACLYLGLVRVGTAIAFSVAFLLLAGVGLQAARRRILALKLAWDAN